jgi:hypothetical protein
VEKTLLNSKLLKVFEKACSNPCHGITWHREQKLCDMIIKHFANHKCIYLKII